MNPDPSKRPDRAIGDPAETLQENFTVTKISILSHTVPEIVNVNREISK